MWVPDENDGMKRIIDSGVITGFSESDGGRLGVIDFSQENVIWSNFDYRCNEQDLRAEIEKETRNSPDFSINQFKSFNPNVYRQDHGQSSLFEQLNAGVKGERGWEVLNKHHRVEKTMFEFNDVETIADYEASYNE